MALNIFGLSSIGRSRTRVIGAAVAAVAASGVFGSVPHAEAAPSLTAGPVAGIGAANGIFDMLNSFLNSVVPGAGSIMPSPTSLMPGQVPSVPGQAPTVPGVPGQVVQTAPTGQQVV